MAGLRTNSLISFVLFVVLHSQALADSGPYSGTAELTVKGKSLVVIHLHHRGRGVTEWYASKVESVSDCARTARNQGVLQVFQGSQRRFCTAVPALSHLWLSPDEQYVVGLSDIRHNNWYQVVVYSTEGTLLFRRAIDCAADRIDRCTMSVTNTIRWFHETDPGIVLDERGRGQLTLSLNSPAHSRIRFDFSKYPKTALDHTPCGRNWQEVSAVMYWIQESTNRAGIISERGDAVCVWVEWHSTRNYFYIPRESFYDPASKQQAFRELYGPSD